MTWESCSTLAIKATRHRDGRRATRTVSPEKARALWNSGLVREANMAFVRLANHDFDVRAAAASYYTS
jgi:hypothetical protein